MKKTTLVFSTITLLLLSMFYASAQQQERPTTLFSKIDNYLNAGVKNGFSGAITVIQNGTIVINKGYGLANKDMQTPNNPNTIFDIGSNTKQFTSTAILKLVELGKLQLDDPLSKFFNDLPSTKEDITIHQLLTHTAGFTESIGRDFDEITEAQFFKELFASELLSEPGEKYAYSNTGYSVLGKIIEIASGQSYEAFLNEYLFAPAGMKQTGYLLPKWDTKRLARGYNRNVLETPPPVTRYQETGDLSWHLKANGGINSTQNDLLRWHKALKTNLVLTPESFRKMTTIYASKPTANYHYGYAWRVMNTKENALRISHNGSNGTFSHSIIWYPEEDLFIVYATNANSAKVEGLAYVVEKLILDENYSPKPITNNVYAYAIEYIREHPTDTSKQLFVSLQKKYAEEYSKSGLLNTLGYVLLRLNENVDWALEFFKKNVQRYPEDGNLWDSLGDGYVANDLKKEAIKSYEKAIELGYNDSQKKLTELVKQ